MSERKKKKKNGSNTPTASSSTSHDSPKPSTSSNDYSVTTERIRVFTAGVSKQQAEILKRSTSDDVISTTTPVTPIASASNSLPFGTQKASTKKRKKKGNATPTNSTQDVVPYGLHSAEPLSWVRLQCNGQNPSKRGFHSCTVVGTDLYIIGGDARTVYFQECYVFSTLTRTWTLLEAASLPRPRTGHACIFAPPPVNKFFIYGGKREEEYLSDMLVFDIGKDRSWRRIKTHGKKPRARGAHSATLIGTKIYVFGGLSYNASQGTGGSRNTLVYLNDMYIFDCLTSSWSLAKVHGTIPSPRAGHATSVVGDMLYVFGGRNGSLLLQDMHVFDTTQMRWSVINTVGDIPATRAGHTMNLVGDHLLLSWGGSDWYKFYDTLHVYDINTRTWFQQPCIGDTPKPRFWHSSSIVGNRLYVFGGGDHEGLFNDIAYLDIGCFLVSEDGYSDSKQSPRGLPPTPTDGEQHAIGSPVASTSYAHNNNNNSGRIGRSASISNQPPLQIDVQPQPNPLTPVHSRPRSDSNISSGETPTTSPPHPSSLASPNSEPLLTLKATMGDVKKLIKLPSVNPTYAELVQKLNRSFSCAVSIKYEDKERDSITISNQDDFDNIIDDYKDRNMKYLLLTVSPIKMQNAEHVAHDHSTADSMAISGIKNGVAQTPQTPQTPVYPIHSGSSSSSTQINSPVQRPSPLTPIVVPTENNINSDNNKLQQSPFTSTPKQKQPEAAAEILARFQKNTRKRIHWKKGDEIGAGAFGRVYQCFTDEGGFVAVKQCALPRKREQIIALERELQIMEDLQKLEHTNIVRYLGVEIDGDCLNIILEYVPGGSLATVLRRFNSFKESVIRNYTKQILLGLKYLHENHIIHRDIKGANILVSDLGVVKLADFGASKSLEDIMSQEQKSLKGSPFWMAPEVINNSNYGFGSDIWSLGCTIIEMATGRPPWSDVIKNNSPYHVMHTIANAKSAPTLPSRISSNLRHFLGRCLDLDPSKRATCDELLQHPFIIYEPTESISNSLNSLTLDDANNIIGSSSSSNFNGGGAEGIPPFVIDSANLQTVEESYNDITFDDDEDESQASTSEHNDVASSSHQTDAASSTPSTSAHMPPYQQYQQQQQPHYYGSPQAAGGSHFPHRQQHMYTEYEYQQNPQQMPLHLPQQQQSQPIAYRAAPQQQQQLGASPSSFNMPSRYSSAVPSEAYNRPYSSSPTTGGYYPPATGTRLAHTTTSTSPTIYPHTGHSAAENNDYYHPQHHQQQQQQSQYQQHPAEYARSIYPTASTSSSAQSRGGYQNSQVSGANNSYHYQQQQPKPQPHSHSYQQPQSQHPHFTSATTGNIIYTHENTDSPMAGDGASEDLILDYLRQQRQQHRSHQ